MHHLTYQIAGVIALLVALTAAFALRRFVTKSADSPGRYKWFGWFQAALGTLCVAMYYLGRIPRPTASRWGGRWPCLAATWLNPAGCGKKSATSKVRSSRSVLRQANELRDYHSAAGSL